MEICTEELFDMGPLWFAREGLRLKFDGHELCKDLVVYIGGFLVDLGGLDCASIVGSLVIPSKLHSTWHPAVGTS